MVRADQKRRSRDVPSLCNIEHHHFKFETNCRPGDLHIHFFGADAFSFWARIQLADGDMMKIGFEDFGRTLCIPVKIDSSADEPVSVIPLS